MDRLKAYASLGKLDGTALTQEQIDTCVKFLSDLDFVFAEK